MEAFLVSLGGVATAEVGDRTQLLSLMLAARFRRPWLILLGVLVATLANHTAAGAVGVWFGSLLTQRHLDGAVGISMIAMALWMLKPDSLDDGGPKLSHAGAFVATAVAFFIAEIGDKTQIATVALAAAYANLAAVIAGTTLGMLAANAPVIFLGNVFATRLPMKAIHAAASILFVAVGLLFLIRAFA